MDDDTTKTGSKRQGTIFVHSLLDDFKLSAPEFRIFGHLRRRKNDKIGTAWPGIKTMAKTCRLAKRTVITAIEHLEWHKMLHVIPKKGCTTHYRVKDSLVAAKRWIRMPSPTCPICRRIRPKKRTVEIATGSTEGTVRSNSGNATGSNEGTEGDPRKDIHEGCPKEGTNPVGSAAVKKAGGGDKTSEAAAGNPVADADTDWTRLKENVDFALKIFNGRIAPGQDADPDNFYKPYPKANQEPLPTTK